MIHDDPAVLENLKGLAEAEEALVRLAQQTLKIARMGLAVAFLGLLVAALLPLMRGESSWHWVLLMSACGLCGYTLGRFDRILVEKNRVRTALQWMDRFK